MDNPEKRATLGTQDEYLPDNPSPLFLSLVWLQKTD